MMGSCPLIATRNFVFVSLTSKSLPLRFAAMGIVMSTSWIVCVHLYGRAACSASSFSFAALSLRARSEGVGDGGPAILCFDVWKSLELAADLGGEEGSLQMWGERAKPPVARAQLGINRCLRL
jgi:hypothetical protein